MLSEETNTEVALKKYMSSVRNSDDKANGRRKTRSQSAKPSSAKRQNFNQIEDITPTTNNASHLLKKESLGGLLKIPSGSIGETSFSNKFKCYLESFYKSNANHQATPMGISTGKT